MSLPNMASVRDLQRDYRRLFDQVKSTGEPLVVLKNNKPEVAVVDIDTLEEMKAQKRRLETLETQEAIRAYKKEKKQGKLKKYKSLNDLMDED